MQKVKYEDIKQTLGPQDPLTIQAEKDLREVSTRAHGAQSRAIAFFDFDDMLNGTKTLIDYTKKHVAGPSIAFLEAKLNERLREKEEIDSQTK